MLIFLVFVCEIETTVVWCWLEPARSLLNWLALENIQKFVYLDEQKLCTNHKLVQVLQLVTAAATKKLLCWQRDRARRCPRWKSACPTRPPACPSPASVCPTQRVSSRTPRPRAYRRPSPTRRSPAGRDCRWLAQRETPCRAHSSSSRLVMFSGWPFFFLVKI